MLLLLLSLLVSAPEARAVRGPACVSSAPSEGGEHTTRVLLSLGHAHTGKAAGRPEAPAAVPVSTVSPSPKLRPCAAYAPPTLAPLAPAATPSSQRDPPRSSA